MARSFSSRYFRKGAPAITVSAHWAKRSRHKAERRRVRGLLRLGFFEYSSTRRPDLYADGTRVQIGGQQARMALLRLPNQRMLHRQHRRRQRELYRRRLVLAS